jgi:hypothetical protein
VALLRLGVALGTALVAWFWLPRPVFACSVCLAGDPLFSQHGTSAQQQGDVSLYLQVQGWRKESGLLPHGRGGGEEEHAEDHEGDAHGEEGTERNRSQRLDLFLSWTPIDRVTLTLDAPFAHNEIEEIEEGGSQTSSLQGLGDVGLSVSYVLWRDRDVLPSTSLEGRALLKTPTGRTDRREDGVVDPHLQTGTGSWDFGFGLAGAHRLTWGSLYGSLFYRENSEGDFDGLDYEYGDTVLVNAALEVPLGHAFALSGLDGWTPGVELNYRWADFDRVEGEKYRDSGGSLLYLTPFTRFRLPFGVGERHASLRVALQLPLTSSWLHGDQEEKEVWSVGLLVPF